MNQDNKNLFLAIGLSSAVLLGWNYFYGVPQMQKQKEAASLAQATSSVPVAAQPNAAAPAGAAPVDVALTREEALAKSPRIRLSAPRLTGSIALKGARIDDISLVNYRETTDPKSPNIVLFEPAGAPNPYYAEFGFVGAAGTKVALPNAQTEWMADKDVLTPQSPVTLTFDNGQGLVFTRTISVDANYMFAVKDTVANTGTEPVTLYPYTLIARRNIPKLAGFGALHEGLLGIVGDSRIQEITYSKIEKATNGKEVLEGTAGWLGFTDKYWASALIPEQNVPFKATFSAFGDVAKTYQTDTLGEAITLEPKSSADVTSHLFAGAKETNTIETYQNALGIKNFDLMIDWGWFYFITKPLFKVIDFIYKFIGNFGLAILMVTVLLRGALFPIANKSYQSMAKMKQVQPQMNEIKERFADDKQKQQQALMELYKKEKINPVSGCLPMLIQIPIFFALYKVILVTIEMRQAPFFGWIKDLSVPDPTHVINLFGLLPFDPTFLPPFLHIGIWPLIMGVTMFLQMKMNPEPADPVQKQMFTYMPIIFTFMLGTMPAGLVIYWTWSNILSILQQSFIMKRAGVKIELFDNLRGLFVKKAG